MTQVMSDTRTPRSYVSDRMQNVVCRSPSKFQSESPFAGRTIAVVRDLSVDEQMYLYAQARRIKHAIKANEDVDVFRVNNPDIGIYLVFMMGSTVTKNSFLRAAQFHNTKVNDFDCASSSFNKKESITDAIKMLAGYSVRQSIFIIRSQSEGACTWLRDCMSDYALRMDIPVPAFINAGDGRHSHPTHEFFDEFSFLEQLQWSQAHIHIVLVGDLFHGRTVHSKAEGLSVFHDVEVDLVAPAELQLPEDVLQRMRDAGFHIRSFETVEDYMSQPKKAKVWYFTNLQTDRFGDKLRDKADAMHRAVSFREEWIPLLDSDVRFYHPMPANTASILNTVPNSIKDTQFNAWDNQATNAFYVRVAILGMVAGVIGRDFSGVAQLIRTETAEDFIEEAPVEQKPLVENPGIKPLVNGVVIDHIATSADVKEIWEHITKVRKVLQLNSMSSHGVSESKGSPGRFKGIISLPDTESFDTDQLKRLAMLAPNCTYNYVQGGAVVLKYRLRTPPVVSGLSDVHCKNPRCISHPTRFEGVAPFFYRSHTVQDTYVCRYCETRHRYEDIWA